MPTVIGVEAAFVAMRSWAKMIRKLDVQIIAPQHGALFRGPEMVQRFISWCENLDCGIDLMNEPFPGERFFDCVAGRCAARYAQAEAVLRSWTERVRAAVIKDFPQPPQYGASITAGHEGNTDYLFERREFETLSRPANPPPAAPPAAPAATPRP